MKKIFRYMVLSLLPLTAASCLNKEIIEPIRGNDAIVLDLSCGNLTKAITAEDLASVGTERYVKHVDVIIFGAQVPVGGETATVFHQRIVWNEAFFVDGTATLNAKRNQFVANQDYKVYVIANSTYSADDFADVKEESDLYQMVQTDANVHLTGLALDSTPDFFLMDGRAYTSGTQAVLNDGNAAHSTVLEADLARAVSKVVVELTAGGKVQFSNPASSIYHYRNLPYSTVTVPATGYEISPALESTDDQPKNAYVQWTNSVAAAEGVEAVTGKVVITGYVYSYSWTALDKETSLIVNIPMKYTEGENSTEEHASNYYKIPLSKDRKFERNNYYKVTAEVNAPGSESNFEPVVLEDLKYDTFPWVDILPPIEVGNETNKPKYLQLNQYSMEMNNIDTDFETLEFSSSSAITSITLVSESAAGLSSMTNTSSTAQTGYYINKFGQPTAISTQIRNQISNGTSWGTTSDDGTTWNKNAINGNIKVYSPIPTNNAPRYLVYKVTNADNMVAYFTVVQYPLEYITNIQAWYSYREDFGCTYETKGNRYVAADDYNTQTGVWEYVRGNSNQFDGSDYFFASRVATEYTSGNNVGMSDMDYYYWSQNGNSVTNVNFASPRNARLYHVVITSSSTKYKVGRPKMTNGVTDSGDDNKSLVSPSFMLASQLGATRICANVQKAAAHCEQYVEVYKDKVTGESVHLKDWRLPTEAEIKVIIDFQYVDDAAVDEVLAGRSYYSASGLVSNPDYTISSTYQAIRCVRDVY